MEIKKMSLANKNGKRSRTAIKNIMAGSGGSFCGGGCTESVGAWNYTSSVSYSACQQDVWTYCSSQPIRLLHLLLGCNYKAGKIESYIIAPSLSNWLFKIEFLKKATLLILLLCSEQVIAQNKIIICGTYKANSKIIVHVYEPINGYYNISFMDMKSENSLLIPDTDSFYYKTDITQPASFLVYITNDDKIMIAKSLIVLFPGDSVHLNMDLINENKESIEYGGSNSKGLKLFNDIDYNPVYKYQKVIDRLNTLKDDKHHFIEDVDSYIQDLLKGFDSLDNKSLITEEFKSYIKTTFTQIIYAFIISKFINNYKQREVLTKYERDSIVDYFFKMQPITDPYLKSSYGSYFYLMDYYNYISYKKYNLSSIEPLYSDKKFTYKEKDYIIKSECAQFLYINDMTAREDLWAIFMLHMNMAAPDFFKETINQFKEIFPDSKWNKMLDKQMQEAHKVVNVEYKLQSPIYFIDSTKDFQTLKKVLKALPNNKPVFLDLWASWCGPCLYTFQFNKQLDSFLLANNIERLYISLDYKGSEKKWQSAINKYALGGYHILATESLISNIKAICNILPNLGIKIPRYMLINKDKVIVLSDAMTPENIHILKKQINEYILKPKQK